MKKFKDYCIPLYLLLCLMFCELRVIAGDTKLHITTDKDSYVASEMVEFQATLLIFSASINQTLFIELLDCHGNKISEKKLPFLLNTVGGNIKLPQTPGVDFYVLYCYVLKKESVEAHCIKKIFINKKEDQIPEGKVVVSCFYEGLTFIADIPNNILIRCNDTNGIPLLVNGEITNDKNETVAKFVTNNRGYAKVNLTPGYMVSYFIQVETKTGEKIKQPMRLGAEVGVSLNISTADSMLKYNVVSYAESIDKVDYKLDIISNGEIVYKAKINFELGLSMISEEFKLNDLPEGFLAFRLADTSNRLCAYRIIYNTYPTSQVNLVKIIDTINNISAITEIPAYINGNGYLKITNPDNTNTSFKNNLPQNSKQPVLENHDDTGLSVNDILISAEAPGNSIALTNSNPNNYLSITGTLFDSEHKPLKNTALTLIMSQKDSKKDFLVVASDNEGKFEINKLVFYDEAILYYRLANTINQNSNIFVEFKVVPTPVTYRPGIPESGFTCANKTEVGASEHTKIKVLPDSLANDIYRNKDVKTLRELEIAGKTEKIKTDSEKFIEKHVSGQYNTTSFLRSEVDFFKTPPVADNSLLVDLLGGRIAGLQIRARLGAPVVIASNGGSVNVYLDEVELDSTNMGLIANMPVRDIALVRYYSMGHKPRGYAVFNGVHTSQTDGGDLMIYTKRGFVNTDPQVSSFAKTTISGYDTPGQDPDSTKKSIDPKSLFWKSNWSPKNYEPIYITLPGSNTEKKIQITIEGVNTNQAPYSFTKNLYLTNQ